MMAEKPADLSLCKTPLPPENTEFYRAPTPEDAT